MTQEDSNEPLVKIVRRGLQVLRTFEAIRIPLANTQIVRHTGFPKSTVSRITTTLVQLGYLRRVPQSKTFELAPACMNMGMAFVEASPLIKIAGPMMQHLADELNVSVALAIADGNDMLYLSYRVSPLVATLRLGVGSLLPIKSTAIGHAWLWGLDPAERKQRINALYRKAAGDDLQLKQAIATSFAELEQTGVCAVLGGYQRDAYGVATPLRVGFQRVPMALSCGSVDVQADLAAESKRIAPHLLQTAHDLTALFIGVNGLP